MKPHHHWSLLIALSWLVPCAAMARENVPNPSLTPGEVWTTDLSLVCQKGYSKTVRKTTKGMKRETYRAYGIKDHAHFKIDHLVPLALGGADTIKNIWPTDFMTADHTADDKDRFEIKARHLACTHVLSVPEAQKIFMTDWRAGYDKYCKTRRDCPSYDEIMENHLPFP